MKVELKFAKLGLGLLTAVLLACQPAAGGKEKESKSVLDGTSKNGSVELNNGWKLKRAQDVKEDGKALSSSNKADKAWIDAVVPGTIMHSLLSAGVYSNVFYKENLAKVPVDSIFVPWWYTNEFEFAKGNEGKPTVMYLNGINYKADIWLNGKLLKDTTALDGAFNVYEIDVTKELKAGKNNIAVKIYPPKNGAYSVGFVDWAPTPPDRNMGIWRSVELKTVESVEIHNTYVRSKLDLEKFSWAELTLETEVTNRTMNDTNVDLAFVFNGDTLKHSLKVAANKTENITLTSKELPQLKLANPKVWWPVGYGDPNMYSLKAIASVNNVPSSYENIEFGVREVADYKNANGHRGYMVNGKKILIKGAGWVDDLFLMDTKQFDENQVQYVVDMNMNCIRFEGFWGKNEDIYSLCDKYGVLAMVGFSCHWEWEDYIGTPCGDQFGCAEEKHEIELLSGYWHDQIKWLRNHPSIYVWVGGSDFLPAPDLERNYIKTINEIDPSRPYLGAAKWHESEVSGPSAVKMEGPYDYVTPNYWYTDTMRGGAFGFNTETGPGPQPPVLASIYKMYGKDVNYPIDTTWNYHCGRHAFKDMSKYMKAFNARYGESKTLEDYALMSQMASYEAIRPMFEAFRVNKPNTTGIVQWMLNSAWPETFWQLYDYYLHPNGAYFGTKKACEPIQAIYNYGDHSVYVVNERVSDAKVGVKIETMSTESKVLSTIDTTVSVTADGSVNLGKLAELVGATEFVFLTVSQEGKELTNNVYWLSKKADVVDPDYKNSSWVYTPNIEFGDLTGVRNLGEATLESSLKKDGENYSVTLKNSGSKIAFGVELTAVKPGTSDPILPVIWSDNYLVLKPGASATLALSFPNKNGSSIEVQVKGTNTKTTVLK